VQQDDELPQILGVVQDVIEPDPKISESGIILYCNDLFKNPTTVPVAISKLFCKFR